MTPFAASFTLAYMEDLIIGIALLKLVYAKRGEEFC
jgi:hypothetical protein